MMPYDIPYIGSSLDVGTEPYCNSSFIVVSSYSSVVESGRCSGNLVRRKFEQSTTVASQRHLGGHTGLLLQSLFKRVSSEPETNIKMLSEDHCYNRRV